MNWLLIIVLAILAINALYGFKKGLIKTVFSFCSILIAITLTTWINPTVNGLMKGNETFYSGVTQNVEKILPLESKDESKNNKDESNDSKNQDINNKDVSKNKNDVSKSNKVESNHGVISSNDKENYINELPIPKSLKNSLLKNEDAYKDLLFENFRDYITKYIADIIINALSFIITFAIITILLWVICFALNIISKLPILNQINKLAGLCAGLLQGLVIVWLFFVFITVLGGTKTGQDALKVIGENEILSFIYNNNILLNFITGATKLLH